MLMKKVKLFLLCIASVISLIANAQEVQVKGTIKDADTSEGIPFASVVVKGTTSGTVSEQTHRQITTIS